MEKETSEQNAETGSDNKAKSGGALSQSEAKQKGSSKDTESGNQGNAHAEVFAHNIEKYGISAKEDEANKRRGLIAAGIAAAAVLCGIVVFLLLH